MMLGIAAKSSIAAPIPPLSLGGQMEVRKIAVPMAMGVATMRAKKVEITVPVRGLKAPKVLSFKLHSVLVKNLKNPKCLMAGTDSTKRLIRIPTINKSIDTAATKDAILKTQFVNSTRFISPFLIYEHERFV
jgi:hypothetical protein